MKKYETGGEGAVETDLNKALEELVAGSEGIFDGVQKEVQSSAKSYIVDVENLTIGQQKQIISMFSSAYAQAGEVGFEYLEKLLSADVPEGLRDEFLNRLSEVNWKEADIETLTGIMDDLGVETNMTGIDLAHFVNIMKDGRLATKALEKSIGELIKTASSLNVGDTISPE
jgi:hypothetical protein